MQTVQERQGLQVGCPEEIGFRRGFLTADELRARGAALGKTAYGKYLIELPLYPGAEVIVTILRRHS